MPRTLNHNPSIKSIVRERTEKRLAYSAMLSVCILADRDSYFYLKIKLKS